VSKIKLLLFGVVLAALLAAPGAAMAKSRDRDHDGLPDKWEKKFHLSTHTKSAKGDPDRDGLNNMGEFRSRTNPRKADTNNNGVGDANDDQDGDGVDNRDEMRDHTNPCDRDTDNDGVNDGEETIGKVASFVEDSANPGSGVLTITLNNGSTVSGKVDSTTEIECRAPEQTTTTPPGSSPKDGSDEGGDHHGDNSGPGNGDEGDHHDGEHRGGDDRQCTTADLTAGTPVHEAELHGSGDSAFFEKVELIK
jgi:thrombospondin type 3 repeat protein